MALGPLHPLPSAFAYLVSGAATPLAPRPIDTDATEATIWQAWWLGASAPAVGNLNMNYPRRLFLGRR